MLKPRLQVSTMHRSDAENTQPATPDAADIPFRETKHDHRHPAAPFALIHP